MSGCGCVGVGCVGGVGGVGVCGVGGGVCVEWCVSV